MHGIRLGKREASEGWQIVGEALWRNETNGIPARIANVLDSERVNIARAQKLIVLGALLAMREVGEMLRASASATARAAKSGPQPDALTRFRGRNL
jgi:hypothetical protein